MAAQAATPAAAIPSAQVVCNAFVDQYYHILHQSPEMVYKFYDNSSVLSRPEPDGTMTSVTTMQAINEKIQSFGYKDYKAEIKTADAQDSYQAGVIVLVTGCLIGKDNLRKKFSQMFFLAPQEKGFFVLNDVFRYVDESGPLDMSSAAAMGGGDVALAAPVPSDPEPAPIPEEPTLAPAITSEAEDINNGPEVCDPSDNEGGSGLEEEEIVDEPPTHSSQQETVTAVDSEASPGQEEKKSYASIVKVAKATARSTSVYVPTSSTRVAPANADQQAPATAKPSAEPEIAPVTSSVTETSNLHEEDPVPMPIEKSAKIYVAGHRGLVGSAVVRKLQSLGYANLLLRTHSGLDLTVQSAVDAFFETHKPDYVILAAAKVGGIHANNTYPADFITLNLQIQTNVITSSYKHGVKKLLFLGSSCIYPKFAPQPIPESALLTGPLEPTNEWYAIAKISGIKMCQAFSIQHGFNATSAMPTNLYGPHDNFHPENSHVLPALVRRFHEAKVRGDERVVVWGSGTPLREFLHVDDLADAVVFLLERYSGLEHVNVGSGKEVTIRELAELVKEVVGFEGELAWDTSKPDGTPRKLMDSSKLAGLGWEPKISLKDGLVGTYKWYLENYQQ